MVRSDGGMDHTRRGAPRSAEDRGRMLAELGHGHQKVAGCRLHGSDFLVADVTRAARLLGPDFGEGSTQDAIRIASEGRNHNLFIIRQLSPSMLDFNSLLFTCK